jgi:flagellin-like protein
MRVGTQGPQPGRAISPVVGSALLLAIIVSLAVVAGGLVLGLGEEQPTAPEAALALQPVDASDDYRLVHQSGAAIDGDRLRIDGAADPDSLAGTEFGAGDTVRITPAADEIEVVWRDDASASSGNSYILGTFDVDPTTGFSGVLAGGGTLQSRVGGQLNAIQGDGGTLSPFGATGSATALGPATVDLDGDGVLELPYIGSGGDLQLVDSDGTTRTLATDGDIAGGIDTDKTRLGVGRWDGSDPSVLFSDGSDDIYRVAPGGTPTSVASPSNGVNAVSGVGDIDGDGTDELVFADGSQTLRHVEPSDPGSGSYDTLPGSGGLSLGSNNGIGAGALFDADGDGTERVAAVDGGNDLVLVDAAGSDKITSDDVTGGSAPSARKAPPTVADVDGDGAQELVYVGNDDGNLKYLDGFESYASGGSEMTAAFLRDESGSKIDGATVTGVTS